MLAVHLNTHTPFPLDLFSVADGRLFSLLLLLLRLCCCCCCGGCCPGFPGFSPLRTLCTASPVSILAIKLGKTLVKKPTKHFAA